MADPISPKQWIAEAFTYYPPRNQEDIDEHEEIRTKGRVLAEAIFQLGEPGEETCKAINHVRSAVMWANAALALKRRDTGGPAPVYPVEPQGLGQCNAPTPQASRLDVLEKRMDMLVQNIGDQVNMIWHHVVPKGGQTGTVDRQWAEVETAKPQRPERPR